LVSQHKHEWFVTLPKRQKIREFGDYTKLDHVYKLAIYVNVTLCVGRSKEFLGICTLCSGHYFIMPNNELWLGNNLKVFYFRDYTKIYKNKDALYNMGFKDLLWLTIRLEYIMLLKLPIILSSNSLIFHLLFSKLFPG